MRWLLVHHNDEALAKEWQARFQKCSDVQIVAGDICRVECDAVVSPANSFGFMDGGLDYALSERFGWGLEKRLQQQIRERPMRELLVGEAILIATGDKKVPWLISAPTMRVPMQLRESINAYLAMKAILCAALGHRADPPIHTVAIPGLGTGVGEVNRAVAARQMFLAYREVVLGEGQYPSGCGKAQQFHLELNPDEIRLWEA